MINWAFVSNDRVMYFWQRALLNYLIRNHLHQSSWLLSNVIICKTISALGYFWTESGHAIRKYTRCPIKIYSSINLVISQHLLKWAAPSCIHFSKMDASHFCQPFHVNVLNRCLKSYYSTKIASNTVCSIEAGLLSPWPYLGNQWSLSCSDAHRYFRLFKPSFNLSYLSISSSIVAERCRRCHLLRFNGLHINGCLMV